MLRTGRRPREGPARGPARGALNLKSKGQGTGLAGAGWGSPQSEPGASPLSAASRPRRPGGPPGDTVCRWRGRPGPPPRRPGPGSRACPAGEARDSELEADHCQWHWQPAVRAQRGLRRQRHASLSSASVMLRACQRPASGDSDRHSGTATVTQLDAAATLAVTPTGSPPWHALWRGARTRNGHWHLDT